MRKVLRLVAFSLASICTLYPIATFGAPLPEFFQTNHDTIPNFAQSPTITSVQNGPWSQASTWNPSRVPTANDIVLISHIVTYETSIGDVTTIGINTGGTLRFVTDQSTVLKVATLLVMPGGTLEIGTEANPIPQNVQAEIIIKDHPLDVTDDGEGIYDPQLFGTGILTIDGTIRMHGVTKSRTFVRFSAEPQAGDITLLVNEAVTGWFPGDYLIIPDSRHLGAGEKGENYIPQWEEVTLASVSSDGKTLTLTSPLQFDHQGARDVTEQLRFLPHVGNLSRNIIIRSENPQGTRGHILLAQRSTVDIRYMAFKDLGRTTIDQIDNTTTDEFGTVTNIGINRDGRFPIHTHHLIGSGTIPANGYQYTLKGNAVLDTTTQTPGFKGGIDIHDSHYGLINDNVVYNRAGCGICLWQGNESYNVFDRNFVVRIYGPGGRADKKPLGSQGTGIWTHSVNSSFRNNVVANVRPKTDTYGFVVYNGKTGKQVIPKFKGADPNVDGIETDMNTLPLREFLNNEVYGAMSGGITIWGLNARGDVNPKGGGQTLIKDFKIWHIYKKGFWNYSMSNVIIDGITIIGDPTKITDSNWGLFMVDYLADKTIIRNADIEGMKWGILAPVQFAEGSPVFTIENSFLANENNIYIQSLWYCCGNNNQSRDLVLRNITFQRLDPQGYNIYMGWNPDDPGDAGKQGDLVEQSRVFVEDYNGNTNEDFQVYYESQASDYVMLEASNKYTGPPEAGLSNQEATQLYGMANAGEVAPCTDDTTYPEIRGFTCPTASSPGETDTIPPQAPSDFQVTYLLGESENLWEEIK